MAEHDDNDPAGSGGDGGAAEAPAGPLSTELAAEIAQRWDPDRLLKLVANRAGRGEALDASLRHRYERKLGVDLSHVRIYTGELAAEVNKSYNAEAVTIGNTGMIIMGGSPEKGLISAAGRGLLAHELTHVAQAQRGVFRDARFGDTMDLATEEHEAEAEEAEHEEIAEHEGGVASHGGGGGGDDAGKHADEVRRRVLEMFADAARDSLERGGSPFRRP